MSVECISKLSKTNTECLIVFGSQKNKAASTKCKFKSVSKELSGLSKSKVFSGAIGESIFIRGFNQEGYNSLLLVGLGEKAMEESFRIAIGYAYRKLEEEKAKAANICYESIQHITKDPTRLGELVGEAVTLAAYNFTTAKSESKYKELNISVLISAANQKKVFSKGLKQGVILGESTNFARWLGDMPANLLTPTQMAKEVQKAAKNTKLKVSVWGQQRLEKEKMGCFLGVAKGSAEEPKMIIMEYKGAPSSKKPISLVGKGLTFDAGGISLKPGAGMEDMKYDMCGAANTIGSALAIARLGLKVNLQAYVGACENLPSGTANKPGDVTTARNGKTVEIINTDAEGRLVLADVLCYASEKKPACIVDMATLTGAMMIALGSTHTGFYTHDDNFAKKLETAGQKSGEKIWRMPLDPAHTKDMKGKYADLSNLDMSRKAGSATAAAFLNEFVDDSIPYIHCDIAGTAFGAGHRTSYHRNISATGCMVRTLTELARDWK